jgi:hypothetical protein
MQGLARFAPLTGVAAVVFWIVGAIVADSSSPGDDAPAAEIVAYFGDEDWTIFTGSALFAFGSALFVWFLASLAAYFRRAGDDGRLATVLVSGGSATAVVAALVTAPAVAGALAVENMDRELSPEAAETLWLLGDGFIVPGSLLAVALLGPAALMILRTGALPSWFGYVTAVLTIGLLVFPIGWAILIWGIPLWTIVTSIWIFTREGRGPTVTVTP